MFIKLLAPFFRLPYIRGKTRMENALRRWCWEPESVTVRGGLKMALDPAEWTQLQLLKRDWIEPLTIALYERLLKPGDVFVDVGAHVGFHSLAGARAVGPSGSVIAVEPQPANAMRLLINARLNGFEQIRTIIAAAGATAGHAWLHDQPSNDRSVLSLGPDGAKDLNQVYRVPLVRMDEVLTSCGIGSVAVLKVDVEGFETDVLRGFGSTLASVNHLILELLEAEAPDARGRELLQLLTDNGFVLKTVEGDPWSPGRPLPERNLWAHRPS